MFGGVAVRVHDNLFREHAGALFRVERDGDHATVSGRNGFPVPFGSSATTRGFDKFYQQGCFPFVCKFKS